MRTRRLRILTISYEFPPIGGGGAKVVNGLSRQFVQMGHDVDVVTMAFSELPRREKVHGADVFRVPCLRGAVDVSYPYEMLSYLPGALMRIRKLIAERQYDVIHCHFIMPDSFLGLLVRRLASIPLVVTAHGSDVPNYNPDRFKLLHRLLAPIWRRVTASIDRIVCPSNFLESLVRDKQGNARTVTIPNGIHVDKFDPGRERRRRVLVVSRMVERKGVQDVLRAMAGIDGDLELHIVGSGPYLDTLKALDRDLGTGAVFHGWLDNDSDELRELFETSLVFVFPSHAENFPLVLLEAMAAGLAIVTTNQTGCREVVGDAARLVAPGDDAAIRRHVTELVADPDTAMRLGRRARRRLEQNFSWPAVAQMYLDVLHEVIGEKQEPVTEGAAN